MDDLIAALCIFRKYANEEYPTHCEHDVLMVGNVGQHALTADDEAEVERLGFTWSQEYGCWISYRFGSA